MKVMRTKDVLPNLKGEPRTLSAPVSLLQLDNAPAPLISQSVGFGDLSLQITSRAVPESSRIVISTNIAVISGRTNEVRFNFPALRAMEQAKPSRIGDSAEAQRFVSAFREKLKASEPSKGEWNFTFPVSITNGKREVFRTRQPIVISTGDQQHCYLIATYSPIPVTLSLLDCW